MNSKPSDTYGLDPAKLPSHVAIIMDGNGRWAKKKLLNRIKGHEKGADTVRMIVRTSREIGISVLTLYAFSTENWERPKAEVGALMLLLKKFLISEKKEMIDNNIRLNVIGQQDRLPMEVQAEIQHTMNSTSANNGMLLNLALSYGGRAEIIRAVQLLASEVKEGRLDAAQISDTMFEKYLYTAGMPDPGLLIRTSGEMRISNFLLWQIAYSEIYVTPTLWPDFTKDEFIRILMDFQTRERRFGRVLEEPL